MTTDLQERVRHEDILHGQRTLAYLTGNAFLVIAFVTALSVRGGTFSAEPGLASAIAVIGTFLGFLFIAVGRRSVIAIRFWRECEKAGVEAGSDDELRTFYEKGRVVLSNESVIARAKRNPDPPHRSLGTVYGAIPWRWMPTRSTNDVLGTLLPAAMTAFWVLAAFGIPWGPAAQVFGFLVPGAVIGTLFLIFALLGAIAYRITWPNLPTFDRSQRLLAVMGRGIQDQGGRWIPSPDFEMYVRVEVAGHVEYRHPGRFSGPIDQASDLCRLGGGEINLLAAAEITGSFGLCVLGFAHPAPYLGSNGPSESACMSETLKQLNPRATVREWHGEGDLSRVSNSEAEVQNVLQLAQEGQFTEVTFLTIEPHLHRVLALARRSPPPSIRIHGIASEAVLRETRPDLAPRLAEIRNSRAYERTRDSEQSGLTALRAGTYR